eukprot:6176408-Pleurochrysis_carterae.AAC.1
MGWVMLASSDSKDCLAKRMQFRTDFQLKPRESIRKRGESKATALACVGVFQQAKLKMSIAKSTKGIKRQIICHSKQSVNCMRGEHLQVEREMRVPRRARLTEASQRDAGQAVRSSRERVGRGSDRGVRAPLRGACTGAGA